MSGPSSFITKIVKAGAGTGKTQSLGQEILSVAMQKHRLTGKWPRLMATTFTERATAELRERVVNLSFQQDVEGLQSFAQNTERLQISTIHGVLSKVLHHYGALMGLDPEFNILSEKEESLLFESALRKKLSELDGPAEAVVDQFGFSESLALLKTLWLHQNQFGSASRWSATWSDFRFEAQQRLSAALKAAAEIPFQDEAPPKLGETHRKIFYLWEEIKNQKLEWEDLKSKFIFTLEGLRSPVATAKAPALREAIKTLFEFKAEFQNPCYEEQINKKFEAIAEKLQSLVKDLAQDVDDLKFKQGALSFSDLEFKTKELITTHPEVAVKIRNLYDHWFIDEFQDTSPLQKEILIQFFKSPWNAYFVGDPEQSIYLFRGAQSKVFFETQEEVVKAKGESLSLDINYRSRPDLLRFMNLLFTPLKSPNDLTGQVGAEIHLVQSEEEDARILTCIDSWVKEGCAHQDIAILVRTNREAQYLGRLLAQKSLPVYVHAPGGFYDKREVLDALCLLRILIHPQDTEAWMTLLRSPWGGVADATLVEWIKKAEGKINLELLTAMVEPWSKMVLEKIQSSLVELKSRPLSLIFENLLSAFGFFELSFVGDDSGRREANLRKLVSQLRSAEVRPQFNAAEWIQTSWEEADSDALSEEREASSFIEPKRIQILTVHKSKGLKFNRVILPYCGTDYMIRPQKLEAAPNGEWATSVLRDDAEQKVSPLALVKLREARAEREIQEHQRLFYVAVTRAAHSLTLISKKEFGKKSWMQKVSEKISLEEGEHQGCYRVVFDIKETLQALGTQAKVENESEYRPDWENLKSAMIQSPYRPPVFIARTEVAKKVSAQAHGIHLHSEIELFRAESELIRRCLEIKNPPIKRLMEVGRREWSFTFKLNSQVYSGRVDLWGKVDEIFWIIDFKSARHISRELTEKTREQLEFYALALEKTGAPWSQIRCAMVLPHSGEAQIFKLNNIEEITSRLRHRPLHQSPLDQI